MYDLTGHWSIRSAFQRMKRRRTTHACHNAPLNTTPPHGRTAASSNVLGNAKGRTCRRVDNGCRNWFPARLRPCSPYSVDRMAHHRRHLTRSPIDLKKEHCQEQQVAASGFSALRSECSSCLPCLCFVSVFVGAAFSNLRPVRRDRKSLELCSHACVALQLFPMRPFCQCP